MGWTINRYVYRRDRDDDSRYSNNDGERVGMLEYNLFSPSRYIETNKVLIDPVHVVSVSTEERRASSAWVPVAVIEMSTGRAYVVDDYGRKVSHQIKEAKNDFNRSSCT